jgi:hypothetical protein
MKLLFRLWSIRGFLISASSGSKGYWVQEHLLHFSIVLLGKFFTAEGELDKETLYLLSYLSWLLIYFNQS